MSNHLLSAVQFYPERRTGKGVGDFPLDLHEISFRQIDALKTNYPPTGGFELAESTDECPFALLSTQKPVMQIENTIEITPKTVKSG